MRSYLLIGLIGLLLACYLLWQWMRSKRLMAIGDKMSAASRPFCRSLAESEMSILIVGDSSGRGIGALDSKSSLAGLIGEKYPRAE